MRLLSIKGAGIAFVISRGGPPRSEAFDMAFAESDYGIDLMADGVLACVGGGETGCRILERGKGRKRLRRANIVELYNVPEKLNAAKHLLKYPNLISRQ